VYGVSDFTKRGEARFPPLWSNRSLSRRNEVCWSGWMCIRREEMWATRCSCLMGVSCMRQLVAVTGVDGGITNGDGGIVDVPFRV
jgi:hypothetical protein